MKYLGHAINNQSTFAQHFRFVVPKATTIANALWSSK